VAAPTGVLAAIGLVPVRPGGRFGRGTAFGDPKSHDWGWVPAQRWPAEVRIEMLATVSRMEEQD
jgi:hypothetical protein